MVVWIAARLCLFLVVCVIAAVINSVVHCDGVIVALCFVV